MINFFKDSIKELKHVVWPTNKETNNYFFIVIVVLTLFGIYLFIASTIFKETLFDLKDSVSKTNNSSDITSPSKIDINKKISPEAVVKDIKIKTEKK